MGGKHNKCCCCGCLQGATECCACTCRRLCVTFTPTDAIDLNDEECLSDYQELDWDELELAFIGTVSGIAVRYYFETTDGVCYFKLRSAELGYGEGYEREWELGRDAYQIACRTLETSVDVSETGYMNCSAGTIDTHCATKVVPALCTGCPCTCECLCITYISEDCSVGVKACWNEVTNSWEATFNCGYGEIDLSIEMRRANESALVNDPYFNPYDESCVLVLNLVDPEDPDQVLVATCPDIVGEWRIVDPYGEDTIITARCAKCGEDCLLRPHGCCPDVILPRILYTTVELYVKIVDIQEPLGSNPNPAVVAEFDCETYVFVSERPYGEADDAGIRQWVGECLSTPQCGTGHIGEFIAKEMHVDLLCGSENDVMSLSWGICDEPSSLFSTTTVTYNCSPFFARIEVPFSLLEYSNNSSNVRTWCCGGPYAMANPPPPFSNWNWQVRVVFTTTG